MQKLGLTSPGSNFRNGNAETERPCIVCIKTIVRERRIPFIIEAPPIPTDIVQFLHRIVLCYSIISHFSLVDLFWQKSLWPCLTKSDCCGHTSCRA